MKLSKKTLFYLTPLILLPLLSLISLPSKNILITPQTETQEKLQEFKKALQLAQYQDSISQLQYRPFFHEIEFQLQTEQQLSTVILSSQKNLYSQVAALQKTLKIAKMEGKQLSFIDLSLKHPYATFKNN